MTKHVTPPCADDPRDGAPSAAANSVLDAVHGPFFRRLDWAAFWTCFLLTLGAYFFTMAPTVTLEDSGELAVASDYLGVPHPPGYPIWTLVTWFGQWMFHFVEYNGHPNPAWGVTFVGSALFGALACGLFALLISRSGTDILRSIPSFTRTLGLKGESAICWISGVSGGLLFAFSPVLWSQSTIVEVYSLNAFFLMAVLTALYIWMCRPEDFRFFYAMAFLFGLGLTNHQSLMFLGLAIVTAVLARELRGWRDALLLLGMIAVVAAGMNSPLPMLFSLGALIPALFLKHTRLFRDFSIVGLLFLSALLVNQWAARAGHPALVWRAGPGKPGFWLWTLLAVYVPVVISFRAKGRQVVSAAFLLVLCAVALNLLAARAGRDLLLLTSGPLSLGFWLWPALGMAGTIAVARLPRRGRLAALGALLLATLFLVGRWAGSFHPEFSMAGGLTSLGFWNGVLFASLVAGLTWFELGHGRQVGLTFLMVELGLSFYLYMPLSSEQNPPMNWGYPRTMEGFMHAITRGQYEKISPAANMKQILANPVFFLRQMHAIIFNPGGYNSVIAQFTWPISLLALAPFFFLRRYGRRAINWIATTLVAFLAMTVIFIVFQYPQLDVQTLFIGRVQYIQAHAIFAMWISYGIILALSALGSLAPRAGRRFRRIAVAGLVVTAMLPAVPLLRNAYDRDFIRTVGSCDQAGHDFGWQFGYYQLTGARGILEELTEEERAAYPNPSYPPEMGTNAIFFGGTDPGRFVPTYMIYSARVRPDVYLITQNALADNTYMQVMRDLYGDDIWIPSQDDSNRAFRHYVDDIRAGRIDAGADVDFKDGRVSVQGVHGVMQINGILARMIFDANKYVQEPDLMRQFEAGADLAGAGVRIMEYEGEPRPVREFYVEESYVIPWMYPYLEPHGLIMRIHPEPTELTEEMIRNDREFWTWYKARLLSDRHFLRDVVAQKTFSKLRSAIAGLYAARGRIEESELAFQQAIDLYPLSPEANFRLADVYIRRGQFDKARHVMKTLLEMDPGNDRVPEFLGRIDAMADLESRRAELEEKFLKGGGGNVQEALELMMVYAQMQEWTHFNQLAGQLLGNDEIAPEAYLQIARLATSARRLDVMELAFTRYTERRPNVPDGWIDLAGAQAMKGKENAAIRSLQQAVRTGGERARARIASDPRFQALRDHPGFRGLAPSPGAGRPAPLPGAVRDLIR